MAENVRYMTEVSVWYCYHGHSHTVFDVMVYMIGSWVWPKHGGLGKPFAPFQAETHYKVIEGEYIPTTKSRESTSCTGQTGGEFEF